MDMRRDFSSHANHGVHDYRHLKVYCNRKIRSKKMVDQWTGPHEGEQPEEDQFATCWLNQWRTRNEHYPVTTVGSEIRLTISYCLERGIQVLVLASCL